MKKDKIIETPHCLEFFNGYKYLMTDKAYKKLKKQKINSEPCVYNLLPEKNEDLDFFKLFSKCNDGKDHIKLLCKNAETFISKNFFTNLIPVFFRTWAWAKDEQGNIYLMSPTYKEIIEEMEDDNICRFFIIRKSEDIYKEFYDEIYIGQGIREAREKKGWEV